MAMLISFDYGNTPLSGKQIAHNSLASLLCKLGLRCTLRVYAGMRGYVPGVY